MAFIGMSAKWNSVFFWPFLACCIFH